MVTYLRRFRRVAAVCLLCVCLAHICFPVHSVELEYSDSYRSGIFYRRLSNVPQTGDQRTDIVNVALSQIGYMENDQGSDLSGCTSGNKNYTEFGLWYKNHVDSSDAFHKAAWCASFVSWCASQAGVSSTVVYYHAYTPAGLNWFSARGQAYTRSQVEKGDYLPQPGDIVYFKSSANSQRVNHVGIVVRYTNGILYAVEGNTYPNAKSNEGGQVCLKSYPISDTFIRYICSPNYT